MGNCVPEPSRVSAERVLAAIAAVQAVMVVVNAVIAVWIGLNGHVWLAVANALCVGFNLRAVLSYLERD